MKRNTAFLTRNRGSVKEKVMMIFQDTLCKLYMISILCVLPLYTHGSYEQLGDVKYLLFRNVSFICVGLWLVAAIICFVQQMPAGKEGLQRQAKAWSIMDSCMAAYGGSVLLSAFLSSYERTAWLGYRDWYMGAVSQLLFVAIYFMISRCYSDGSLLPYLGEAAMLFVCVIAFLQRLEIDVLGLHKLFDKRDWEYKHMLSTVGNINWLCGYLSVAIVFSVSAYLHSEKDWKGAVHYFVSVAGLVLLCIQGSDIGWVLCAACIGICFVWGLKNIVYIEKSLLLAAGTIFCLPCFAKLVLLRGSMYTFPEDGNTFERISWQGWWFVLASLLLVIGLIKWQQKRRWHQSSDKQLVGGGLYDRKKLPAQKEIPVWKKLFDMRIVAVAVAFVICVTVIILGLPEDFWKEGRGALWKLAWSGFLHADGLQKLVGAGPDCFAEYLHNGVQTSIVIHSSGHWSGAIFANAHNEWLNQLVNIGLLGAVCYLSIFVAAIKRYRGMLFGVLAVGLYFVNSLVSFQQVMNAPFLFLVLGLCENRKLAHKLLIVKQSAK